MRSTCSDRRGRWPSLSHLGEPHLFRPYNNLRFHPGPPLKEHLGVAVGYGAAGGYYFELSLDGLVVAGGSTGQRPTSSNASGRRSTTGGGLRFERAVAVGEAAGLSLAEPELKRPPRGYKADHPRLDYLRLKRITLSRRHPLKPLLHSAAAMRWCDQSSRQRGRWSRGWQTRWVHRRCVGGTRSRPGRAGPAIRGKTHTRRWTRRGLFDSHRYTVEIAPALAMNRTSVRFSPLGCPSRGRVPVTPLALGWLIVAGQSARMRP